MELNALNIFIIFSYVHPVEIFNELKDVCWSICFVFLYL